MAGQPGYEFIGHWRDAAAVKEAFLAAGEKYSLVQVGAMAYPTSGPESGWIPAPTPALYGDPGLLDYRRWLPLYGIEGQRPLAYSATCPSHIWNYQAFATWITEIMHNAGDASHAGEFRKQVARAEPQRQFTSPAANRLFRDLAAGTN